MPKTPSNLSPPMAEDLDKKLLSFFLRAEQGYSPTTAPVSTQAEATRLRFILHQWRARHRKAGSLPPFCERVSFTIEECQGGFCIRANTAPGGARLLEILPDPPQEIEPSPYIPEERIDPLATSPHDLYMYTE